MLVPAYRVTLDGQDISARLGARLIGLSLSERRDQAADQLDIQLDDADGRLTIPRLGVALNLQLGFVGGPMVDKGRFTVDEVEHGGPPAVLTLRARSADFTGGTRTRRARSWTDTTLGAVLGDIARGMGLTLRCAPDLASIPIAAIEQGRRSEAAFLAALGRRYDAVATAKAGRLVFARIGAGRTAGGQAIPAATIRRGDGDRHSYRVAKREQYDAVEAKWHDKQGGTKRKVKIGSGEKVKHVRRTFGSEAEAREYAESEKARAGRAQASLTLDLAVGRPDLYPEQRVTLAGFKGPIDAGRWLIAAVTHNVGQGGYVTSVELEAG